jgi:hypothetical protein
MRIRELEYKFKLFLFHLFNFHLIKKKKSLKINHQKKYIYLKKFNLVNI